MITAPEIAPSATPLQDFERGFETPFSEYLGARLGNGWQATSQMIAGRFAEREEGAAPATRTARGVITQPLGGGSMFVPEERRRAWSEDEWKASPYFRPELDYDPNMSESKAQALAEQRDAQVYRNWLSDRGSTGTLRGVVGFGAELVGSLPDPLNLIPFAGPAWRAAAVGRYGAVGGRALVGAAEAGIGQAIIEPFSVADRVTLGEDVKFADVLFDLALGAAAGGVIGGGSGLIAKLRGKGAEPILSVDQQRTAAQPLNEAAASIALGHDVAIRPETLEAVRPIRAEFEAAGRMLDAEERVRGLDPEERARLLDALPEAERMQAQGMEVTARTVTDPMVAAKLREDVDRILVRQMAAEAPAVRDMDTATPRQDAPDPALKEAAAAVGRSELPAETAARVMGGQTLGAEPRQAAGSEAAAPRQEPRPQGEKKAPPPRDEPEVSALRQAGRLTKDMEAAVRAADEAATKAEAVADALDAAAACLVRAA